jgi:hypothetical protein
LKLRCMPPRWPSASACISIVYLSCAHTRKYSLGVNIQTNKNAPAKKKYEYEVGRATFLVFLKRTLWMSWCTLSGPRLNISLHSVMTCGTRAS